jgi:hypothetical protein
MAMDRPDDLVPRDPLGSSGSSIFMTENQHSLTHRVARLIRSGRAKRVQRLDGTLDRRPLGSARSDRGMTAHAAPSGKKPQLR